MTFEHAGSGDSRTAAGFFAADGNAGESSATGGNKWRVHFSPPRAGEWRWRASFRSGRDVAIADEPSAGAPWAPLDGRTGAFTVAASDKQAPDFRARGHLEYVGERYLRFAGDGTRYLKGAWTARRPCSATRTSTARSWIAAPATILQRPTRQSISPRSWTYRELAARFSHHPAITWNLGEENVQTPAQQKAAASWIRRLLPYTQHIVIHNDHWHARNVRDTFDPLLGFPGITGTSLQDFYWNDVHTHVRHYVRASAESGW